MQLVGIKELKDRLTYYLKLTREGDNIIVTDRGAPFAVIHSLDAAEGNASAEEKLASLARQGLIRLPVRKGHLKKIKAIRAPGKPASEIIMEDRK